MLCAARPFAFLMLAGVLGCAGEGAPSKEPRPAPRSLQRVEVSEGLQPMLDDCIAGNADSCESLGRYLDGGPHPDCQGQESRHPYGDDECAAIPTLRDEGFLLGEEPPPDPEVEALYGAALRIRKRDCDAGQAGACDALAEQIERERGQPRDDARVEALRERANALRTQACEGGEPEACLELADASSGRIARDYEHRACAVGHLETCVELLDALAQLRLQPDMRERERFVAAYWKRQEKRGVMSGGALAAAALGQQDAPVEAFEAGCKAKKAEACYVASTLLGTSPLAMAMTGASWGELDGEPSEEDQARAAAQRERAAEAHRKAMEKREKLRERARRLFARDCEQGDARACWSRGHMHQEDNELEPAQALYEQACAAGEAKGCLARGRLILAAAERPADMGGASDWLARGCELDAGHGCGELALILECGLGVDADAARAAELYAQACAAETRAACWRFE